MILFAMLAAAPAPACTVPPPPPVACIRKGDLPSGFERWDAIAPVRGPLRPGGAIMAPLTLSAGDGTRPGCEGSVAVRIAKPGTYAFALSASGWIDLVGRHGPLAPVAHEHGPACSGVAKIVAFRLTPGRYTLKLSKAAGASVKLMALRR